ncbi:autoinducer binding domain-containing protein [Roseobacter sp. HKCCD8291]|uniref:helix-turn-helix transcriptional regulator n=1 Tax=unclassified Roseobacter TaxID=196798 RepID=UPI00345FD03F
MRAGCDNPIKRAKRSGSIFSDIPLTFSPEGSEFIVDPVSGNLSKKTCLFVGSMSKTPALDLLLHELSLATPGGYAVGLHIRYVSPLIMVNTYPEEWQEIYTAKVYGLRDPTLAWGLSHTGVRRWSEIGLPDPFGILKESAEYGMHYGMICSIGPLSSRTIAGATRPDREYTQEEMEHVHKIVQRMHDLSVPPTKLSNAQIEALRCIAEGDRHAAAAAKLGISESAFKARLTSARQKLMARTTAEAVQRAKEYGLI